jgi:hypothetical protein
MGFESTMATNESGAAKNPSAQFDVAELLSRHEVTEWKGSTTSSHNNYRLSNGLYGMLFGTTLGNTSVLAARTMRTSALGNLGLGVSVLAADSTIDRFLFRGQERGYGTIGADLVATPALMFLPAPWYVRGGAMIGAHIAGRLIDKHLF